jgi:hypothetical protein
MSLKSIFVFYILQGIVVVLHKVFNNRLTLRKWTARLCWTARI